MTTAVIVRHAKAVPRNPGDHPSRPLTPKGQEVHQEVTRRFLDAGYSADLLFSSSYVRARETAEIMGKMLSLPLQETEALHAENFDSGTLLEILQTNHGRATILVGHDPTLYLFVNGLLGDQMFEDEMHKSGIAIITFVGKVGYGKGILVDYLSPG